jgi:hypothetical protein
MERTNTQKLSKSTQIMSIKSSKIVCEYCNSIVSHRKNMKRHYKICKHKIKHDIEMSKDKIIDDLKKKNEEATNQLKLLKDLIKHNNNVVNYNTVNAFYVMNNYTNAKKYKELMNRDALSNEQFLEIKNMGAKYAPAKLLEVLCIDNIKPEDRSIHCVDIARNKFMVKEEDWVVDDKGSKIVDGLIPIIEEMYIKNAQEDIRKARGDLEEVTKVLKNQGTALQIMSHKKDRDITNTVKGSIATSNIKIK